MTQIRANITTAVNAAKIRRETRNGRAVIVVPSATLPDNVIMNRIMYPADVIEAGYKTLERTPAPLGHPAVNGVYINANDPEAINGFWVGAWNENVRRENGRVKLDKVIDVERAESTEEGKRLLAAINEQKPIHTSTGLMLAVNEVEHEDYDRVATEMVGDHDCFLLDQPGAATPDQGVGVFVNSAGEHVEVVNSELEMDDDLLTMMAWEMVNEYDRAEKRQRNGGLVERIKNAVRAVMNGTSTDEATGLTTNSDTSNGENHMTPEELQAALDKQAENMTAAFNAKLDETVKPLQDKLDAINAEKEAAAEAEKTTLVETVVEAKLATEDEAKALDVNALRIMARNAKPQKQADHGLNGGRIDTNADDVMSQYAAPKGDE